MSKNTKSFLWKIILILAGAVISAYGITLALHAGFGGTTLSVLWQGISIRSGLSIGTASFLVAVVMIIFVLFYDVRQIHIGTILHQIAYSFFIDVFSQVHLYTNIAAVNFFIMLFGIVVFSAGIGLYSSANLGRGSYEALTFALADKRHWQVKYVRMGLDLAFVVSGCLLGGQIGICTICTIFLSGPVIQRTMKYLEKIKLRSHKHT